MKRIKVSKTLAAGLLLILLSLTAGCGGIFDVAGRDTNGTAMGEASVASGNVSFTMAIDSGLESRSVTGPEVAAVHVFGLAGGTITGPIVLTRQGEAWRGSASLADGNYVFYAWAYDDKTVNGEGYTLGDPLFFGDSPPVLITSEGSNLITITTKDLAAVPMGAIGPAGGIIFHHQPGEHWYYLEAWTTDEVDTHKWKTNNEWTGGTSTAIGSGHVNTYTHMTGEAHPAAEVARNAAHGNYTDWFLPSRDELNQMYEHRAVIGGFVEADYWSSSEYSESEPDNAWGQWFGDGLQGWDRKDSTIQVRVARIFPPPPPLTGVLFEAVGQSNIDAVRVFAQSGSAAPQGPYTLTKNAGTWQGLAEGLATGTWNFYLWTYDSDNQATHWGSATDVNVTAGQGFIQVVELSYVDEHSAVPLNAIGPAGGWIFFDKGSWLDNWRYLEAWTTDEVDTHKWKTNYEWTGGTSTAIGSGHVNTYTHMTGEAHPAAEVARNAAHGNYTDWFLPSRDELNQMYEHRAVIGGFAEADYWSSSEYSFSEPEKAWGQWFGDGFFQNWDWKDSTIQVRVVRAF